MSKKYADSEDSSQNPIPSRLLIVLIGRTFCMPEANPVLREFSNGDSFEADVIHFRNPQYEHHVMLSGHDSHTRRLELSGHNLQSTRSAEDKIRRPPPRSTHLLAKGSLRKPWSGQDFKSCPHLSVTATLLRFAGQLANTYIRNFSLAI